MEYVARRERFVTCRESFLQKVSAGSCCFQVLADLDQNAVPALARRSASMGTAVSGENVIDRP